MGGECPKQYLALLGKPVLAHTLERLGSLGEIQEIVVCVGENDEYFASLSPCPARLSRAPGGEERFHSVLNGLRKLSARAGEEDWVLVHDAARPCVRPSDIRRLIRELDAHPVGGLLATPVRDTLKRADASNQVADTVNRERLWHALTPQMFRLGLLREALEQVVSQNLMVTDDAQAVERLGHQPLLVEGHADNIKLTHPQDLALAELFLRQQAAG